ncbi:PIN domain-containing protein [uncultured Rhodoblastus sp.]|uniref:PIN domain-containing protein n=1 Tax=uncultured Rhodoblastus sp. TaxID=543037 RepID=UPI0025DBA005|nr:PIN domain-containing protein [uncultured Rhodoblastus sp.]
MTVFFDTNILVYSLAGDRRGAIAREILRGGGIVSVQVLNEFVRVARNKLRLDWPTIDSALNAFRDLVGDVAPLTLAIHEAALELARRDGINIFDALIVAAAREAGCDVLYSEDMQHGRVFGRLKIINPFA